MTLTPTTAPAETAAQGLSENTCPPWCEIDDHQDWYGSERHHATTIVTLSSYPHEVTSTETGAPVTTRYADWLNVIRIQVRDHEPVIAIELPDESNLADPDGIIDKNSGSAMFTFAEAQETGVALLVMAGREGGSSHAPGDPALCCPEQALRASAYPTAVFCPSCGTLYWRTEAPEGTGPAPRETLPYWLSRPCPAWCRMSHTENDSRDDRVHSSDCHSIELALEPLTGIGDETFPATLNAEMWMDYRDARPHICLTVNDREEILLELGEAEEAARLLAAPPGEWVSVVLTMMDPDHVMPPGCPETGPVPEPMSMFRVHPFCHRPVLAVRKALDSVMVFSPVQAPDRDQSPRYLAFTPAEAAELAAVITKLLDGAK